VKSAECVSQAAWGKIRIVPPSVIRQNLPGDTRCQNSLLSELAAAVCRAQICCVLDFTTYRKHGIASRGVTAMSASIPGALIRSAKTILKVVIPEPLRDRIRLTLSRRWEAKFKGQPTANVFGAIYKQGKWGHGSEGDFCSGRGSHDPAIVGPYIEAVAGFLRSIPDLPSVVDLGCGDFNIGKQLRPYVGNFIACDVVPELIARNVLKFGGESVDFQCLDVVEDDLPFADVALIRQVLQHLSNSQISRIVPKLYRYRFLVISEHLPVEDNFIPNLEKTSGVTIRLPSHSGVVLTRPPFNLRVRSEKIICSNLQSIRSYKGIVNTIVYELESNA
jgi:hypothetical protein